MNRIPRIPRRTVAAALLFTTALQAATAQCSAIGGLAHLACEAAARAAQAALKKSLAAPAAGAALTTGMSDAYHSALRDPAVSPSTFRPLSSLSRAGDGSFLIRPGAYEAYVESYSFDSQDDDAARAGTFFPAPLKGSRAGIIAIALKRSELHPEISPSSLQQLLSAITAGTSLDKMPQDAQQTAAVILPAATLKQLRSSGQTKAFMREVMSHLPEPGDGQAGTEQTPGGAPSSPEGAPSQPKADATNATGQLTPVRGTWAVMPGGFYVRYLPDATSRTRVQIIVPDIAVAFADPAAPLMFDPTQFIAVMAGSPGLRLGITLRPVEAPKP